MTPRRRRRRGPPRRHSPLRTFARASRARADRVKRHGSRWIRWLPPQFEFLSAPERLKLLRCGNQAYGKTTAGLTAVIWRCLGTHPFLEVRKPPIEAWIVCASWKQSVAIQAKFWALVPRDELAEGTRFDPKRGFIGKDPIVEFANGSIVRFKTTRQDTLDLSSATIHVVLIDEPPKSQRVFEELKKRVMRTGGVVLLTLTPINAPTDYLRELAEAGGIRDVWYPLRAEFLIPIGCSDPLLLEDGRPMDAEWVAEVRAETLAREEPIIVDGEWETRVEGRVFVAFDTRPVGGEHITDEVPDFDFAALLGVDHGVRDFKQFAALAGVRWEWEEDDRAQRRRKRYPHLYVFDEYAGTGFTTEDDDADGILLMLGRWGWQWADLSEARGDKPYDAGKIVGRVGRKSNAKLAAAVAHRLGIRTARKLVPPIRQAKTGKLGGRGSIDLGCTWLHRLMIRPGHFKVHRRCARLIEALERWDWTDSDFKDPIDALRYATWRYAVRSSSPTGRRTSTYVY